MTPGCDACRSLWTLPACDGCGKPASHHHHDHPHLCWYPYGPVLPYRSRQVAIDAVLCALHNVTKEPCP